MLKRNTPLKRTPLNRISKKGKEKKVKESKERELMWLMFLEIWEERPHYSEISGKYLGNEPLTYMFDHALEKETHPQFKLTKENIILCTLEEHHAKTGGHPLNEHKKLIDQIKQKLNE